MRIFSSILVVMLTSFFCTACGSAASSPHDGDGSDSGQSADASANDAAIDAWHGSGDATSDASYEGGAGTDGGTGADAGIDGGTIVTAIAAGGHHVCALFSDGSVRCWGYNSDGQLGDGTSTGPQTCNKAACSMTPVSVPGLSGAKAIAAGQSHTCALLLGGTVECWGVNNYGQLGDGMSAGPQTCGSDACSTTPVAVSGLSGVVTAIAAAGDDTCALLSGGTVECWGANYYGQLGDGTYTGPQTCSSGACSTTPVAVSGLSGATAIATGGNDTCALLLGGTVDCWGDNTYGELGDGTTTGPQTCGGNIPCSMTAVAVPGLSGVIALSAVSAGTCALLSGGTVECWGDNTYGELGDGTSTGPQTCLSGTSPCSTKPVAVAGLSGVMVTAITAKEIHTCALTSAGAVECWGDNEVGELGDGTSTGPQKCTGFACSTTPVAVSGLGGVTAVTAGLLDSCALRAGGVVECWGDNEYGDLGIGTSTGPQTCGSVPCSTSPVAVSGL